MTSTANLPWDTDGTTVNTGGDLHARATALALTAMDAIGDEPITDLADTDYGRAQARYEADLKQIRDENSRNHIAANNARAQAAAAARADRQAAHEARNEAAKLDKLQRKLAKAA